ncbi:MAG: zinc-binding alcohol dehydrogenase family protein [Burkholderiales bacterium]|nr:zinc-binding alcohol dehydrogenase family protein [Burkholderiales bacterium]
MKAVVVPRPLPVTDPGCFADAELDDPAPGPRDLLVAVEAVSVNPLDCKQRLVASRVAGRARVLGYDAAGTVRAVGAAVTLFAPGDRVYYAGDVRRDGCNSQLHLVDERIAGRMPASLDFAAAAALPLTAITAWESLFDRLRVAAPPRAQPRKSLLVVGGAGGVGSIAIQLGAKVAGLDVIATASRPASAAWCRELGAAAVVDHAGDLVAAVRGLGRRQVDHVLITNDAARHFGACAQLLAPQGGICSIIRADAPVDVSALMGKSCSVSWEFMFTRPANDTADMVEQHHLLNEVARLVDQGIVRATATDVRAPISAATLRAAHAQVEAGRSIGKIVLSGWA